MSNLRRPELFPHFGTRVEVSAQIAGVSFVENRAKFNERTLRVESITVQGEESNVTYLWLRLGPNASVRLNKLLPKLYPGSPVRFSAEVRYYENENGGSMCLERLADCEVYADGRWRLLNRNVERTYSSDRERLSQWEVTEYQNTQLMEQQRPVIEQVAQLSRRDKSVAEICRKFFLQHLPVSDRQFQHAQRLIGG